MTGDATGTVSGNDAIASFYERHPYPPPVRDLDTYRERWSDQARRRAEFHRHYPEKSFDAELRVLVAGCGTSQAARHALRWPEGRVTGIDVSVSSLRATEALKDRYELGNLTVHQLPIERVAELGESYDLIVCTGVLHHLADPVVGLRMLTEVLDPSGAMNLMVYGRYARAGVEMIRDYARLLGIEPTSGEINDFAETLREVPMAHPISPSLRDSPDFRSPGALADALLNPRERSYSVPEVLDLLAAAGLDFGRWNLQAPYRPQCGGPSTTPHATRLANLPDRDQFAAMELFRGTMRRHTVIARSQGSLLASDGGIDAESVPIRLPEAATIDERPPPGAAAVLINTAHTNTDLVMPISQDERELVDAIDGQRSIGQIVENLREGRSPARDDPLGFFERLWLWDQIVFDHSPG